METCDSLRHKERLLSYGYWGPGHGCLQKWFQISIFYCFTLFTSLSSPVDWIWQLMAPKIQWFTPSRMVNHFRRDWDSYEHSSLFWMSPASQTLFWSFDDNEPIVKTLLTWMMTRTLFSLQWYKTMTFYLNFVSSCYINTLSTNIFINTSAVIRSFTVCLTILYPGLELYFLVH